ncbi:GNAT family N-acetyltransferase [uncultured Amnibacterium sp.]|uniref:GNAT family N-acetyltransferase n=1 Tax=uncultured Amnibacterium sp. TaxID=1631851 RepID=UPI0035CB0F39
MSSPRLVPTSDPALWDRVVRSLPQHTQFHTWDWLQLVQRLLHVRVDHLLVVDDGAPVGVLPVVRGARPGLVAPGMPFPYLGPLVPDALLGGTVRAFRAWQLRHGVAFAVFDLPPGVEGEAALTAAGASARVTSTVVVDLPAEEGALVERYSSMRRRSLRRAEKAGARVVPAAPGDVAAVLDGVLEQAYEAHGVPSPYPTGTAAIVEDWMAGRDDVFALTAYVGDEPAGVHLVLTGGPRTLSWVVACDRRFREVGPNAVLYHEALVESVRRGFAQMDLVGRVDDGVARFKTSFGGHEVAYVAADSFLGPALLRTSAKRAKALLRPSRTASAEAAEAAGAPDQPVPSRADEPAAP